MTLSFRIREFVNPPRIIHLIDSVYFASGRYRLKAATQPPNLGQNSFRIKWQPNPQRKWHSDKTVSCKMTEILDTSRQTVLVSLPRRPLVPYSPVRNKSGTSDCAMNMLFILIDSLID